MNKPTQQGLASSLWLLLIAISLNAHATTTINWGGCGISKLGFMQDLARAYEQETGVHINLEGGGATKGIRMVASNHIDIGGSCRLPLVVRNPDGSYSIDKAESHVKTIPVGWDALVVIANPNNHGIDSISREQLREVLTGTITNWRQLGAERDAPINLYVRQGKISGVGLTLRQQLFNNRDQDFTVRANILPSSGKIEQAVENDPNGLAVSGISSSRHRQLRLLKLDGIEPSMHTLQSGDYKLFRILFLVTPPNYAEHQVVKSFVDFALSAKGQRIIQDAGTLPYHRGVRLLYTSTSPEYLQAIDAVEQAGIYTLSGN